MGGVRDGLVTPEPSAGRYIVVQDPIVTTLSYPPAIGLVLATEQLAERPDVRGRVSFRHGHGSHDGWVRRRRSHGGRRGRGGRLLLGG